jgi:hypothetical protein
MKATPFNPESDLPPIPFDELHCKSAASLKAAGLSWKPHVGCFVWDPDEHIEVRSPFPFRVYFILNMGHFLKIFGTAEEIAAKLVWLPTFHQARLLCSEFGVDKEEISEVFRAERNIEQGDELLVLYKLLLSKLGRII